MAYSDCTLQEAARRLGRRISLSSGVAFPVDEALGLTGACGSNRAASPKPRFLSTPVAVVVKTQREEIRGGLGQGVAAMAAAPLYHERAGHRSALIHAAVATGTRWQALRLEAARVQVDARDSCIPSLPKIPGILVSFLPQREDRNRLVAEHRSWPGAEKAGSG